jgi:Glycosyl hydrolases related to GH101 family, GH129
MKRIPKTLLVLAPLLAAASISAPAWATDTVLENDLLHVVFSGADGSMAVTVLDSGDAWTQTPAAGYQVSSVAATPTSLDASVHGGNSTLAVHVALVDGAREITVTIDGDGYTRLPAYPYPFTLPADQGYYVQNTSGDGALFSLKETASIEHIYDFISVPWWGLTDFSKGMMAILETSFLPSATKSAIVHLPMTLRYVFLPGAGYVEMARDYRKRLFAANPGLEAKTLASKASEPGVANLKDGVYVYFWDDARDGAFMKEVHDAGIEKATAMTYYGSHDMTDAELATMYSAAKTSGWTAGLYNMPGGNLTAVAPGDWNENLLLGADPVAFFSAHPDGWDHTCSTASVDSKPGELHDLATATGVELMYFDTYVAQLAPCLDETHPGHTHLLPSPAALPSTLEAERQARIDVLDATHGPVSAVGSGEGAAPAWAVPHVEFFEGAMMLRTYGEVESHIPSGDYKNDFEPASDGPPDGAMNTDETHRIPLFEMMFHDHTATTWNWRNTNFQSLATSAKKDLFNALYGTMPMWNMTKAHWMAHRTDFLASYAFQARSRSRVGFDDMIGHGWLSDDRELQYTDWASGVRIVANFGAAARQTGGVTVPPLDFVVLDAPGDAGVAVGSGAGGSSAAASGSGAGGAPANGDGPGAGSSCGCRVAGTGADGLAGWCAVAGLALGIGRRRRRSR